MKREKLAGYGLYMPVKPSRWKRLKRFLLRWKRYDCDVRTFTAENSNPTFLGKVVKMNEDGTAWVQIGGKEDVGP